MERFQRKKQERQTTPTNILTISEAVVHYHGRQIKQVDLINDDVFSLLLILVVIWAYSHVAS